MSTLTLKVEAEQTGLAQLKGLLEQMQSLVQSGGAVRQSLQTSSAGFNQFQQAAVAAKTEVAVFEQEIKGLKSANETLSKSIKDLAQSQKEVAPATKLSAESLRTYMQIALAASTSQTALVTALREQKKEVQANLAASDKLANITSRQAANVMALAGVQALLNSAFQKQVAIKSQILGLDNAALTSIKAETNNLRLQNAALLENANLSSALVNAKVQAAALQDKSNQVLMREVSTLQLANKEYREHILLQGAYKPAANMTDPRLMVGGAGARESIETLRAMNTEYTRAARAAEIRTAMERRDAIETANTRVATAINADRQIMASAAARVQEARVLSSAQEEREKKRIAVVTAMELRAAREVIAARTTSARIANQIYMESQVARVKAERAAAVVPTTVVAASSSATISKIKETTAATVDLRSALRGAAGAMGGLWMTYGKDIVVLASFYALARAIKDTVGAEMEFNRELRSMQAVAGQSDEQIAKISEQLLNLNTIQGPRELAEGMRVMAKAGVEAQESIKGIQSIATLAMSDDASLESTTKLITRVMTVFDKAGKDIPEITDTIAYAASQSVMELGDFAQALSQTSELSTLMKIDLTQISAGFMLLADHGLQGGKGATALRTSLLRLLSPTKEAQQMMERLGFSAKHADGSLKDLREIATDFSKVMSTLTPGARIEVMSQLGDLRSMKALALIGTQAQELTSNMDELTNKSQGFTKQLEEINLKSSSVQWDKLTADIERVVLQFTKSIDLDSGLAGAFRSIGSTLTGLATDARMLGDYLGIINDYIQKIRASDAGSAGVSGASGNWLLDSFNIAAGARAINKSMVDPLYAVFVEPFVNLHKYLQERNNHIKAIENQAETEASFLSLTTPRLMTEGPETLKYAGAVELSSKEEFFAKLSGLDSKGLEQLQKTYEQKKKLREDDLAYQKQLWENEVSLIQAKIQNKVAVSAEGYEKIKDLKTRELKLELDYAVANKALLEDRMNSGTISKDSGGPELTTLNNKIRLTQAQLSLETQLAQVQKEGDRLEFEKKVDALLDKRTNQYYPEALKAEYELSDRYDADIKAVQNMQIPLEGIVAQEARRAEIIADVDAKYEHLTSQLSRQQADTAETTMEKALKRLNDEELPEYERGLARIAEKYDDAIALVNEWERAGVSAAENNIAAEQKYHDEAAALRGDLKEKQTTAMEQFAEEHDSMTGFWKKAMGDMRAATEDFFVSAIKGDFDNIGLAFLEMVNDMVARWAAAQMQMALWGSTSGAGNGWVGAVISGVGAYFGSSSGAASTSTMSSPSVWAADGGVFSGGISSLSGSVYSGPTYFGYDKQVTGFASGGVLGEADRYEAVVPLSRTRSGRLGVEVSGTGGGGARGVVVNIREIRVERAEGSNDQEDAQKTANLVSALIKREIKLALNDEQRPGGILNRQGAY